MKSDPRSIDTLRVPLPAVLMPLDARGYVMTPVEVGHMPRTDFLVKVVGMRPFRTKKHFCKDHPNATKWLRD